MDWRLQCPGGSCWKENGYLILIRTRWRGMRLLSSVVYHFLYLPYPLGSPWESCPGPDTGVSSGTVAHGHKLWISTSNSLILFSLKPTHLTFVINLCCSALWAVIPGNLVLWYCAPKAAVSVPLPASFQAYLTPPMVISGNCRPTVGDPWGGDLAIRRSFSFPLLLSFPCLLLSQFLFIPLENYDLDA